MSQATDASTSNTIAKPSLALDKRLRLSVMMFLEFAIWGAWFVVFSDYCKYTLKFSPAQVGSLYGTIALGAIVAMMFAGQIADRLMPAQYLLAICHLGGAALLFVMSKTHDYSSLWWITLGYALLYNPTLSLSNTVAFANVSDSARDFPTLRVMGTLGWIVAASATDWLLPAHSALSSRPLLLAAALSAALGVFSLILPSTPPPDKRQDSIPFLRALKLLTDPSFGAFFVITFLAVSIALGFYYTFIGTFLPDVHFDKPGTVSTIGQCSEIFFMLLLPFALKKLGMKTVVLVGMAAWTARYIVFAIPGHPKPWVILGVALHGVSFDFFLAAGFIYTDEKAPEAIRGSAQALFGFIVYGVGMWFGNILSGQVNNHYTVNGISDWTKIWTIPAIGAAVCFLLFLFVWRDRPNPQHIQA